MSQESRRNSMFFGSHEGASRAAILYSIAISCRLNGINLFEYISDVIEKTIEWQPNTPLEKYRDLLPDRWKKQQQHLFNQLLLFFLNYARYKRGDAYTYCHKTAKNALISAISIDYFFKNVLIPSKNIAHFNEKCNIFFKKHNVSCKNQWKKGMSFYKYG